MRRAAFAALLCASCLVPREPQGRPDDACTQCHGDPARPGPALTRAAPPKDLQGNPHVPYVGVGAHLLHLLGGPTSRAVACAACHPVPSEPGHSDGVVQVVLDGGGAWQPGPRTCAESSCHGAASGVWTRPRSSAEACGTCHGLPPKAPHPQAGPATCAACHGALDAGQHVDGVVQTITASCTACHGSADAGEPLGGAHAAHRVPCATCHVVPAAPVTPLHPNGGRAEVKVPGWNAATQTCGASCHFGASPPWTAPGPLSCKGCHGEPPAAPHPQLQQCDTCHPAVARGKHLNGTTDVAVPAACDACHGSAQSPAPPRDVDGGTDPSRPGVGAHQAHLLPNGRSRPVGCAECHAVPAQTLAPQHVDGVTQVRFLGIAAFGTPRYQGGTCAGTGCHDVQHFTMASGSSGGGTTPAPLWTKVDGSQATCTSCHGQPPPLPHPARSDCATCHPAVGPLHVNGRIDFVP